jgi:regulator of cell morphogenesis and NO signaling
MSGDLSRTVAELVVERPSRARAFEQLGIDYCCGGKRSLADACSDRAIDPAAALAALDTAAPADAGEDRDWAAVPLAELCDHIVEIHHARLREELPRLSGLLEKVVRAHEAERPELNELRRTFEAMRAELEEHTVDEEERLFPACRAGTPFVRAELAELEHEHAATGELLERLRELADGYDLDRALCNTHRALLDGLRELELDLHLHVHEENNVLFPRVPVA